MQNFQIKMFTRWFTWFFRIFNVYQCFFILNILFDEVNKGLRHEKKLILLGIIFNVFFFLKAVLHELN